MNLDKVHLKTPDPTSDSVSDITHFEIGYPNPNLNMSFDASSTSKELWKVKNPYARKILTGFYNFQEQCFTFEDMISSVFASKKVVTMKDIQHLIRIPKDTFNKMEQILHNICKILPHEPSSFEHPQRLVIRHPHSATNLQHDVHDSPDNILADSIKAIRESGVRARILTSRNQQVSLEVPPFHNPAPLISCAEEIGLVAKLTQCPNPMIRISAPTTVTPDRLYETLLMQNPDVKSFLDSFPTDSDSCHMNIKNGNLSNKFKYIIDIECSGPLFTILMKERQDVTLDCYPIHPKEIHPILRCHHCHQVGHKKDICKKLMKAKAFLRDTLNTESVHVAKHCKRCMSIPKKECRMLKCTPFCYNCSRNPNLTATHSTFDKECSSYIRAVESRKQRVSYSKHSIRKKKDICYFVKTFNSRLTDLRQKLKTQRKNLKDSLSTPSEITENRDIFTGINPGIQKNADDKTLENTSADIRHSDFTSDSYKTSDSDKTSVLNPNNTVQQIKKDARMVNTPDSTANKSITDTTSDSFRMPIHQMNINSVDTIHPSSEATLRCPVCKKLLKNKDAFINHISFTPTPPHNDFRKQHGDNYKEKALEMTSARIPIQPSTASDQTIPDAQNHADSESLPLRSDIREKMWTILRLSAEFDKHLRAVGKPDTLQDTLKILSQFVSDKGIPGDVTSNFRKRYETIHKKKYPTAGQSRGEEYTEKDSRNQNQETTYKQCKEIMKEGGFDHLPKRVADFVGSFDDICFHAQQNDIPQQMLLKYIKEIEDSAIKHYRGKAEYIRRNFKSQYDDSDTDDSDLEPELQKLSDGYARYGTKYPG